MGNLCVYTNTNFFTGIPPFHIFRHYETSPVFDFIQKILNAPKGSQSIFLIFRNRMDVRESQRVTSQIFFDTETILIFVFSSKIF